MRTVLHNPASCSVLQSEQLIIVSTCYKSHYLSFANFAPPLKKEPVSLNLKWPSVENRKLRVA